MGARIVSIGTAWPAHSMTQARAAELVGARCCRDAREVRALARLFRRSTVEARGISLLGADEGRPPDEVGFDAFYPPVNGEPPGSAARGGPTTDRRMRRFDRFAPELARVAASRALAEAAIEAGRITHLVVVTCTGFSAPGVEVALIKRLRLPRTVRRVQVGFMGCHGALNGLQVAAALGRADGAARVLVCCVELCSLHFRYGWDSAQMVPNALFADGAAALVVAGGEGGREADWILADTASILFDGTERDMTWRIGDHGFEMTLSARVPEIVAERVRPWLDDWLTCCGTSVDRIGSWAIHAGGPRIVSAVAERLGLDATAVQPSMDVLRRHGNMSSATLPFILHRLRKGRGALPCVALGFGPGLVAEGALFTEG